MAHFYLRITPADKADKTKLVISVSKKISKKAVIRNRIRRRIRPLLREFVSELKPATYFIVAKSGAEKIKGQELKAELVELFKKR